METMGVAEMKLDFDALGLVQEAMRPMAGSFSAEQSQSFVSADGTMHLVLRGDEPDGHRPARVPGAHAPGGCIQRPFPCDMPGETDHPRDGAQCLRGRNFAGHAV